MDQLSYFISVLKSAKIQMHLPAQSFTCSTYGALVSNSVGKVLLGFCPSLRHYLEEIFHHTVLSPEPSPTVLIASVMPTEFVFLGTQQDQSELWPN